jgi:hypothetical protein
MNLLQTSEYLDFIEVKDTGKTKVWDVRSRRSGYTLGIIKWYGPWRQYTFWPAPDTIWNQTCLGDVEAFIILKMHERRTHEVQS